MNYYWPTDCIVNLNICKRFCWLNWERVDRWMPTVNWSSKVASSKSKSKVCFVSTSRNTLLARHVDRQRPYCKKRRVYFSCNAKHVDRDDLWPTSRVVSKLLLVGVLPSVPVLPRNHTFYIILFPVHSFICFGWVNTLCAKVKHWYSCFWSSSFHHGWACTLTVCPNRLQRRTAVACSWLASCNSFSAWCSGWCTPSCPIWSTPIRAWMSILFQGEPSDCLPAHWVVDGNACLCKQNEWWFGVNQWQAISIGFTWAAANRAQLVNGMSTSSVKELSYLAMVTHSLISTLSTLPLRMVAVSQARDWWAPGTYLQFCFLR